MENREIRIVTDSTADLPQSFAQQHRVTVVPLRVNFPEGGDYLDGVELAAKDFYPMLLAAGDAIPKTSTPTKDDFLRTYRNVLEESPDCQIISIHLSGGLSSTISVAETAAREIDAEIYPFDSRNISFGMGLQVVEALRMIAEEAGVKKILDHLALVASHTETMFCLDTLEYLYKGGRIGKVTAFFGSILNIKPIIHVKDGIYESFDKVRSQRQAIDRMLERSLSLLDGRSPLRSAVIHGACGLMADALKAKAEVAFGKALDAFEETGAVIGTHTGPGTLGMTICHL